MKHPTKTKVRCSTHRANSTLDIRKLSFGNIDAPLEDITGSPLSHFLENQFRHF